MPERMEKSRRAESENERVSDRFMNEGSFGEGINSASYVAPAVTQKVEYGEDQGGLIDWFRRKRMKISEPTLVPDSQAGKDSEGHGFLSHRSKAIGEMVANATPEQLRSDPALQQLVLSDFNTSFSQRLQAHNAQSREDEMTNMRAKEGELWSFNQVLKSMLPEGYGANLMKASGGDTWDAMNMISGDFGEGGQLEKIGEYMGGAREAFRGSNFLDSDEEASQALMNNFMLRTVQPDLVNSLDPAQMKMSQALGKEVGELTKNDELRKTGWFLQSVRRFFGKK